jgi:uncharacterized protein (UPF0261 family)
MPQLPIAISTGPHTRQCVETMRRLLTKRGREIRSYEADGRGGRQLEADVLADRISAVLDLTLTEIAAESLGLPGGAGPSRLTAAALRDIPQVIGLGGIDAVGEHRLTPEECDRLGQEIAHKASAARGATTILVPLQSVSPVLVRSLHNWISPNVRVRELDLHINDSVFAAAMIDALQIETKP